ncbi:MAG: hypothetical protein QF535_14365, partial [Anaerolineales bacterium]|nr:hypothetical protein [Anaerolineales bacterium]
APSKKAIFDKISSMGLYTHEWTHESEATTSKVRSNHTGYYGIGSSMAFSDITHRLTIAGDLRYTGDLYITEGTEIKPYPARMYDAPIVKFITASGGLPGGNNSPFQDGTVFYTRVGICNNSSTFETYEPTVPLEIGVSSFNSCNNNSGSGTFQIGKGTTYNVGFDPEGKIQARNGNGGAADLRLNSTGGTVNLGDSSGATVAHGDFLVKGNLTVKGTATSISTAQVTMEDPFLLLNAESTGGDVDSGIEVERGDALTNRKLFWDEGDDAWKIQTGDSTFTEIAGGGGTLTGTNTGDVTIVLASGVPSGSVTLSNQQVTLGDKFVYNEGTANAIGVDGGADGKLSLFGTEGGSGTGTTALVVKGGNSASANPAVKITGALEATTKSFNIPHPINSNKRLVYGCLEGPEYGMYQRGSFLVDDERRLVAIDLPNYWYKMVHDDYAINLTTYGDYNVWISNRDENGFWVETNAEGEWSFDWSVIGGRKDAKLVVEPDA